MRYSEVDERYKIDIISFLRNYLGITGYSLKQNRLTHNDLKVLFPNLNLTRLPYELAYKNPELVYSGEYLIVYDANYELIIYKNPLIMENVLPNEESNYEDSRDTINLPDLHSLSKDELLRLRRKTRGTGEYHKANEITKQIRKIKRTEPRGYKRDKEELRNKELEEDYYEKNKRRWVFK